MLVTLTPRQMRMGCNHAIERKLESLYGKFANHDFKPKDFAWRDEIEGTLAEIAVAEALNLPWTGAKTWDAPADVGENIQVRKTAAIGVDCEHCAFPITADAGHRPIRGCYRTESNPPEEKHRHCCSHHRKCAGS